MNEPRPMTEQEQRIAEREFEYVRSAHAALTMSGVSDEDVTVAKMRLSDWLADHRDRWTV